MIKTYGATQAHERLNCVGVIWPQIPFTDREEIARELLGLLEMRCLIQGNLVPLQCRQCIGMFWTQESLPGLPDLPKVGSGFIIFVGEVRQKVPQREFCLEGQQICRSQVPAAQVERPPQIPFGLRFVPQQVIGPADGQS